MKPKSVKNTDGVRMLDDSETYNLTHLSPLKEFARGRLIHRDFNAHVFRWLHAAMLMHKNPKREEAAVLDIACGPDWPLLTTMHSNGCAPGYFMGVDLRDCGGTKPNAKKTQISFVQVDVTKALPLAFAYNEQVGEDSTGVPEYVTKEKTWDMIVCFEVLEHMPKGTGQKLLDNIAAVMMPNTTLLFSTPVFNGTMAENHIYEWGYQELKDELEQRFVLEDHFGTFASIKDYADKLTPDQAALVARLKQYYNSAVVSNIMGPLFPEASRNVLWQLRKK